MAKRFDASGSGRIVVTRWELAAAQIQVIEIGFCCAWTS